MLRILHNEINMLISTLNKFPVLLKYIRDLKKIWLIKNDIKIFFIPYITIVCEPYSDLLLVQFS